MTGMAIDLKKRGSLLLIAMLVGAVIVTSCSPKEKADNITASSQTNNCAITQSDNRSGVITAKSLWMEYVAEHVILDANDQEHTRYEKRFDTTDIARAQEHIPFTIVMPTYVPALKLGATPDIDGSLEISDPSQAEIRIRYQIYRQGIITITETTHNFSLGEPSVDPDLERIQIGNKAVVRTRDNQNFSFTSNNLNFVIQAYFVSGDEVYKVVESMIRAD
jgi:hypothetical protein